MGPQKFWMLNCQKDKIGMRFNMTRSFVNTIMLPRTKYVSHRVSHVRRPTHSPCWGSSQLLYCETPCSQSQLARPSVDTRGHSLYCQRPLMKKWTGLIRFSFLDIRIGKQAINTWSWKKPRRMGGKQNKKMEGALPPPLGSQQVWNVWGSRNLEVKKICTE